MLDYHTHPPHQPLSSQDSQPLATRAPSIDNPIKKEGAATAACKNDAQNSDREVSLTPLNPFPLPRQFFCHRSTCFPFGKHTRHHICLPRILLNPYTSKTISHIFDNIYTLYVNSFYVYINHYT